MSETQQRQKHPRLLLNIVLIILETFFSFILTHDGVLRLQAKKFISNKTTIRINSYLPFLTFMFNLQKRVCCSISILLTDVLILKSIVHLSI